MNAGMFSFGEISFLKQASQILGIGFHHIHIYLLENLDMVGFFRDVTNDLDEYTPIDRDRYSTA